MKLRFTNGVLVLPERLYMNGTLEVVDGRIHSVRDNLITFDHSSLMKEAEWTTIDLQGHILSPGYVDLHVHGGAGADLMDGTEEAFRTVCQSHARHGTTSLLPTTTVAREDQILSVLELCREFHDKDTGGARSIGAHFYGPYFGPEAVGCHPKHPLRPPTSEEYQKYLKYADVITTATVAPELPGAAGFLGACHKHNIRTNVGHSHATFEQMTQAVELGVRHVDHLFCAMSDRARLRQSQTYPMRGGVMEATLYYDELTTEVIADGKHLQAELLMLALKIKGPDRLALVTDCNRALDMPDGEYIFGPKEGGEPIIRRDDVGIMPDGKSLASGVMGMDHCVRTFHKLTAVPMWEVVRMASLTPARIAGWDNEIGSLEVGKRADLLILNSEWEVEQTWIEGIHIK